MLRVYRGTKKIRVKTLTFKPVNGGAAGVATLKVKSGKPGRLSLRASHRATPALATAVAKTVRLDAVQPVRRPAAHAARPCGSCRPSSPAMHYVVPRTGVYDSGTANAVMAWRKVAGMSRTYVGDVRRLLRPARRQRASSRSATPRTATTSRRGSTPQVLALIDGGKVQRIYHTSSGAPSTPTVRGKFRVYLKTPGTNAKGMVDSNYFIRGYAIHGYASVPPYNASHGCLRVPVANARAIYDWLRIGDVVWVEA